MSIEDLGRLEPIDPRRIWTSEAGDFTPWLAKEENLGLLGDTIGIDLELEAQEKEVGPFRADILCKDTSSGCWVLVENQLERTDHAHLGQLLTYAAGLKAVTIVWIADRFTEEHRAALDWLNEITDDRFDFFGLEVELWKIGDSLVAPKFNMVCKPNQWSRTIGGAAKRLGDAALSETNQLYLEYWTALLEHWEKNKCPIRSGKPKPQGWTAYAVGRSNFLVVVAISKVKKTVAVYLALYGGDRFAHFHLLREQRAAIEKALGSELDWRELPSGKECQIKRVFDATDPANKSDWPRQQETIRQTVEAFHVLFAPLVKGLDAADYRPDSAEPEA